MIPTIGRVVWFNDGRSSQRVPGLICYVHDHNTINFGGYDSNGLNIAAQSVRLCEPGEICAVGQAEWMPYQVNQAAKAPDTVGSPESGKYPI